MKKLCVFIVVFIMALVMGANVSAGIIDAGPITYTTSIGAFWWMSGDLADGIVSSDIFNDAEWLGFGSSELLTVDFDLHGTYALAAVDVTYLAASWWDQRAPARVDLTFSTDGVNYGDLVTETSFIGDDGIQTKLIGVPDVTCQYVRAVLTAPQVNGAYWHRLSEFTFSEVPEPATVSLLSVGLLALIRRKK